MTGEDGVRIMVRSGSFLEALARLAPEPLPGAGFPRCPHSWCDRPWHGLPVLAGAEEPPRRSARTAAPSDSLVLCPGSGLPGPDLRVGRTQLP
ncbi:hypothetical protein [Nocardia harenae]|uniref:hypothetical protein n=1 Tax=Nocardia harenae TaxID=358707 RepID=UPI00082F7062|nr:hypothetical protein [Nocardia harenae]